jgi:dipeptide transport system permease protein
VVDNIIMRVVDIMLALPSLLLALVLVAILAPRSATPRWR